MFQIRLSRNFYLSMILLGLFLRIIIWGNTIGSNDVFLWIEHAKLLATRGLIGAYQTPGPFNHPPLPALYAEWIWHVSGYHEALFAKLIKLPSLFGDILIIWLLARFYSLRLGALFSLLPAPILVTAFHGNTDSLYAAFLLAAVTSHVKGRYMLAGLFFSLSLNVKLLPLVLLFPFLISCQTPKALLQTLGGLALGMIPFYYPLLAAPADLHRNMLQYNSNPDNWGIQCFLNQLHIFGVEEVASDLGDYYSHIGRYIIVFGGISIAFVARFRKNMDIKQVLFLCGTFFFLMTPGFGVQYVVFTLPLFLIYSEIRGVLWGLTSGIFIGSVYYTFMTDWSLYISTFTTWFPSYTQLIGLIPWSLCYIWFMKWLREERSPVESGSVQPAFVPKPALNVKSS